MASNKFTDVDDDGDGGRSNDDVEHMGRTTTGWLTGWLDDWLAGWLAMYSVQHRRAVYGLNPSETHTPHRARIQIQLSTTPSSLVMLCMFHIAGRSVFVYMAAEWHIVYSTMHYILNVVRFARVF